ncbi:MAG: glycosyltransferase family 4 protein [Limnochordaceae bacterium]|nr:glycosyltransferase family 4 protein [Limnochordaceae bacterium]
MRIGLLGPITWRTPPRRYGPWEQVVSHLAEGLTRRGHEVTLFATADSETAARLVAVCPRPLGEDPRLDAKSYELLHMAEAFRLAREGAFELLHNHFNAHPLAFSPLVDTPIVTTLHGSALLEPSTHLIYRRFAHLPYVSISNAERDGLPELRYVATVYNGVDLRQFTYSSRAEGYLAFLGRMSPKKGAHLAVELARRTGIPLKMAALIPPDERDFFEREIRPHLDGRRIEYVGHLGPEERDRFLGGARALVHLCTVPEPFGLALVEAQACGTPVIGMDLGAVGEVVRHGETGYVVHTLEEAQQAARALDRIDRAACRRWVESRFTVDRMVEQYERVYEAVLDASSARRSRSATASSSSRSGAV